MFSLSHPVQPVDIYSDPSMQMSGTYQKCIWVHKHGEISDKNCMSDLHTQITDHRSQITGNRQMQAAIG